MRNLVHGALAKAQPILTHVVDALNAGDVDSMDEHLLRYVALFRNDPTGLAGQKWVAENLPRGANAVIEYHRFQSAMEDELYKRGFTRVKGGPLVSEQVPASQGSLWPASTVKPAPVSGMPPGGKGNATPKR
jgi:hypothetical protein